MDNRIKQQVIQGVKKEIEAWNSDIRKEGYTIFVLKSDPGFEGLAHYINLHKLLRDLINFKPIR